MRRSDDELGCCYFRKDAAILGQASRESSTRLYLRYRKSGDAIDATSAIPERVKQKPSNKVIKT